MKTQKHSLTIGIQRINNYFHLTIKATGKLTHEDYEELTPILENALLGVNKPRIRAFVDCSELEGWDLHAAWDDFKIGLKHGNEFEKVAILTNKNWLEYSSKVVSWFIHGEIETFEDEYEAFEWIIR